MARSSRPKTRPFRSLCLALGAAVLAGSAGAELPDPPEADVTADRAFVGDPLLGLEPGQPGSLWGRLADDPDGMASTTKTFTLLLAAEAIEAGLADYDDAVPVSANAQRVNLQHSHGAMNGPPIAPGTLFRLEDLLTTMILDSDADATISVGEHIARRTNPALVNMCNVFPFICVGTFWEAIFVSQMNARAGELGLSDTLFFNAQGSDHGHDAVGNSTGSVPHETTAREMAIWYDHGMQNPVFRDIIGRQGTYTFTPIGSAASYSATASFGYPGMNGQKGGSNSDCGTCNVASSERAGRTMIGTYLQGPGGRDALFDYGFATTFHPTHRGESSDSLAPPVDHALECASSVRAVSAVATQGGDVDVHTWAIGGSGQSISLLENPRPGPIVVVDDLIRGIGGDPIPIDDLVLDPRTDEEFELVTAYAEYAEARTFEDRSYPFRTSVRVPPGSSAQTSKWPAKWKMFSLDGKGTTMPSTHGTPFDPLDLPIEVIGGDALQVDVAYVGNGQVAVGVAREDVIELQVWGLPADGEPFFRAEANVGVGTEVRVHSPNPNLAVVAYRDTDGFLQLQSWSIDAGDGSLDPLASVAGHEVEELRIDGQTSFENYQLPIPGSFPDFQSRFVVASRAPGDSVVTRSYRVLPNGAILSLNAVSFGTGTHVRIARVEGYHPWAEVFAVAYRTASSEPLVRIYQMGFFGTIDFEGSLGVSELEVGPAGRLEIESYRERGVLVAAKASGSNPETGLAALSVDRDTAGLDDLNLLIDRTTDVSGDLVGLCRIPGDAAEGDFLLAEEGFFDSQVRLEAWRSAPRQSGIACGLGFEGALALLPLFALRRLRCPRR
ncbi:MAG: serine hydrolase [Myxococcota bacterium]|nr:serine hydrolase [Myxococcota bacterium]